jgi:crotonobetainyl-CoA:carnitine CoA-transferase CaiB-like acyl-CoA transferase
MTAATELLRGATVLEVSGRVSAAYCGWQLAAMGATVTRVELPLSSSAPAAVAPALEAALGRGKRVVAPGPQADGLAVAAELMITDVLDDDGADGAATSVALRLSELRGAGSPLLSIPQFASTGPDAGRPGTPLITGAETGASWSIGDPEREPLSIPFDIPDALAGSEAAAAAILCLGGVAASGAVPSRVEVPVAGVLGYYVGMIATNFVPYGRPWHRDGPQASVSGGSYPAAIFACADGAVAIMCRQAREWDGLRAAIGEPSWAGRPELVDARAVARSHVAEVDPVVRAWARSHTYAELSALGEEHGFPVAAVREVGESLTDPQYLHREFFETITDPASSKPVQVPGLPFAIAAAHDGGELPPRPAAPTAALPLAGVRVLDFTWVWSGPTVTAALCDLGAEVIKVENAARPDSARARGGGLREGRPIEGPPLEISSYFSAVNRGKRSIAVDLTTDAGRELILRLVGSCDVVVENMRPGALDRRGLGYEDLARENPGLVMLSMSTAGRSGPLSGAGGYAPVMSGLAGLEALVRYEDSEPMGLFNLALADPNAAGHGLVALLAALRHRRLSGEGSWLDLSQMECVSAVLTEPLLEAQLLGGAEAPANRHPSFAPHGHFAAAGEDAWLAVAVRTEAERSRLAALLGAAPGAALEPALAEFARQREPAPAAAELNAIGVPAAPLRSYEQTQGPDRLASALVTHPFIGEERIGALCWALDGEHLRPRDRAPLLGEHTDAVLAELAAIEGSVA